MNATIAQDAGWSPVKTYMLETKYEFLKLIRLPGQVLPSILFPAMFYLLFGVGFGSGTLGTGRVNMATYLLATYGSFGVIGAALMGFGVAVAVERGQGWMMLKRASPMPPAALFLAKLVICALFAAVIMSILATLGVTLAHVRLPADAWIRLATTLVLGAIPFCALGLGIGYLAGPNSVAPTVNLIYLPMGFLSGLWIPIEVLPPFIKSIAPFLPAYHFAQLALDAIGAGVRTPAWTHIVALTGFTLIGLGLAFLGYRRDEDRVYG
jgi:ABC-2 type transport system permease protein